MRAVNHFGPGLKERIAILNKILAPLESYTPLQAVLSGSRKKTVVQACTDHVHSYAAKSRLQEKRLLARALKSKIQKRSEHWIKPELWKEFLESIRDLHDATPHFMTEWETDDDERAEYMRSLIESGEQLLFLNLGGVSKHVYDEKTAAAFRRLVKRSSPSVLLTFGWPRQRGERKLDHLDPQIRELSKDYNAKRAAQILEANPFLREVKAYGDRTGKVVMIALRQRIENHFAMAFWSRSETKEQDIDLGVEILHSERKHIRRMLNPRAPQAVCLEVGIVLNHLLNIGISASKPADAGNIWFIFEEGGNPQDI